MKSERQCESLSRGFAVPWTVACPGPVSMEFSRFSLSKYLLPLSVCFILYLERYGVLHSILISNHFLDSLYLW